MIQGDTCFYLRFLYVHSIFLADKGIFMDSKQKVVKRSQNNCRFSSRELAISSKVLKTLRLVCFSQPRPSIPQGALLLDIARGLIVTLTSAALTVNTTQNNFLEYSLPTAHRPTDPIVIFKRLANRKIFIHFIEQKHSWEIYFGLLSI